MIYFLLSRPRFSVLLFTRKIISIRLRSKLFGLDSQKYSILAISVSIPRQKNHKIRLPLRKVSLKPIFQPALTASRIITIYLDISSRVKR